MLSRRLVVLVGGLLIVLLGGRQLANVPVNRSSTEVVSVTIPPGLGGRGIARALKQAGILRSTSGFVVQVVLTGARGKLKAGTYVFSPRESGSSMLGRIIRGDTLPTDASVTIPEGFTLKQIAARIAAQGVTDEAAFLAHAVVSKFSAEFPILRDAPASASLEGYLFPDTYRFARGTVPDEIIRRMLRRFTEQWERANEGVGSRPTSNTHAVVTMASIIEREVRSAEDRRLVSGVLWKRLDAGAGLDADATIRYALGNWEKPLTVNDLRVDSPYNTRRYRGLPQGPIGNPGIDSLVAALDPTSSAYLYYLSASDDGRTIFSRTLDEHNAAKAKYLH